MLGSDLVNKEWTLHVEDFAKIELADVKISPLICFVGDNNSGKSYLMSLLWGILTLGKSLFPKVPSDSKCYKKCEAWLKEHANSDFEMDEKAINLYVSWFNDLLNQNKKKLLFRIFNYDVTAEKIEIRDYKRENPLSLRWHDMSERYSVTETYVRFPMNDDTYSREDLLRMNAYICWNILMEGIAAPLYTPAVKGRRNGEPVYLPASRTGFMLTYPQIVESSLQMSFLPSAQDEVANGLTLPYVDFLQLITKFEPKSKVSIKYKKIIEFMEANMTMGNVFVKKEMLPRIMYKPKNSTDEIPLYVASSIVAEISPLLLLFKSDINFKTLIIEEPEAHLHPALQQKMAQLIINLVNMGIPVWITTHSDTILQHINNMIKLKNNQNVNELMNQFDYKENDLIHESQISMYQFEPTNSGKTSSGKTNLKGLECTPYGFVVSTFNDALENILQEVYAFQED